MSMLISQIISINLNLYDRRCSDTLDLMWSHRHSQLKYLNINFEIVKITFHFHYTCACDYINIKISFMDSCAQVHKCLRL